MIMNECFCRRCRSKLIELSKEQKPFADKYGPIYLSFCQKCKDLSFNEICDIINNDRLNY
jgi:RNase P subunit RPR2